MMPPPLPPKFRRLNLFFMVLIMKIVVSQSHVVENLPGFHGKLPFTLHTGYVSVGELELFYYFVESERKPEDDPLLLWFTGGPGCSGFSSLVYDIGPLIFYYANSDGPIPKLVSNPYSWTKVANIIFIDQPAGTGFSYAKTPEAYKTSATLLGITGYDFLKKWLMNHPKYLHNPLYLGGGSYCGIFVPLVVDQIFKGIEAGSKPHLNFKSTKENCNGNYLSVNVDNSLCKDDLERATLCLDKINLMHILEPSCEIEERGIVQHHMSSSSSSRFLQSSVPLPAKSWCREMDMLYSTKWANIKLVQKALNVREGTITEWKRCNSTLKRDHVFDVHSTVNYHKDFARKDIRALIHSGDHDMGVPHTTTEEWIRSIKLQIKSEWRPWFVDGQIAGYTTAYLEEGGYELTYATIKGGGHEPSQQKPMECLSMVDKWLNNNHL